MQRENLLRISLIFVFTAILFLPAVQALADDTGAIPKRADIEDQFKWKVEDIYPSIEAWEADFEFVKGQLGSFEPFKGHLGDAPEMLLGCLKLSDSVDIVTSNLYVYAYLKLDEDNSSGEYQELTGRISALNSQLVEATSFMQPEMISLGKEKLMSFLNQNQGLQVYRFSIEDQLRRQEHILSPEEESILALAGPAASASAATFNMIDNADHKLGKVLDSDGNVVEMTPGRYYRILEGTDRDLRRRANDTAQISWKKYVNSLSSTLDGSLQRDLFYSKARGYDDCLSMSLDANNIPTSVVYNLVETVSRNLAPLHKLMSLRKKVLGVDTLFTYDMSVSLVADFEIEYEYDVAKKMLLEGLEPLGEKYLTDLEVGLNSGWVDVYENDGKGSGAYSWGTYTSHPYILMNYNNTLDAVFTLAHEFGHAMNSFYTNSVETYPYHGHSLFTAEVASTCNEAILMKYLLSQTESKEEKMVLLNHYIRQISGTFFTQVMFTEFELAIHKQIESGGATSADWFRKTYRDIYQKFYGPDLVIGENNDMGGMKISHFYRQYYVYQYATSYAAAQAISQKILEGDKNSLEGYMTFLETGSSMYPIDILKAAGVDMTSPEPVERTIALFSELVDEMEVLLLQ
ncbi:MAG: oligoendopeptidase F [bacterium]|nr:oligoendopeptidase F [bacterium]